MLVEKRFDPSPRVASRANGSMPHSFITQSEFLSFVRVPRDRSDSNATPTPPVSLSVLLLVPQSVPSFVLTPKSIPNPIPNVVPNLNVAPDSVLAVVFQTLDQMSLLIAGQIKTFVDRMNHIGRFLKTCADPLTPARRDLRSNFQPILV